MKKILLIISIFLTAFTIMIAGNKIKTIIAVSAVPQKVIQTAQKQIKGLEVTSAKKVEKRGKVYYKLIGRTASPKKGFELKITAEGKLIEMELEEDYPVLAKELPEAVKKGIQTVVKGLAIQEAELDRQKGTYKIEGTASGKHYEIKTDKTGKILKFEQDDND